MKKYYITALFVATGLYASTAIASDMGRVSQPERDIARDMGKVSTPVAVKVSVPLIQVKG
ncbi:hypothetical protein [Candidatus Venteria ishoeyi]|uniref:Uncharacterized protein n=1 Tax=Candidatus Venteria ishoeyi TaxID=1899563 RepID=A0A1H6F422_9GAMM|nr:hypothetical protein [Candidatus Venteria ishoeyi]MDM8547732.1 hypothetical protein [Candidatus Venteria ishoeyi]SEH04832.1 Uncharacterised protein [Candidatus Venteria ishoeyi]